MARVKLSPELKKAISNLPHKEKDKLLFRLIGGNESLVKILEFELLEDSSTLEERREELTESIVKSLEEYDYYSPGYLLMLLRSLSGDINRHVKTTKDKFGEIYLNFLMLNKTFELFGPFLQQAPYQRAITFNEYVVKRILKLLKLLSAIHEDYHIEFTDSMKELGEHLGENHYLMKTAIYNMLDVNWLLRGEIPEKF